MLDRIHWLGHACFRINGPPHDDGPIIYLDPWRLPLDAPPADIILVSHDHHDHCSPADISRIYRDHTVVFSNQRAADSLDIPVQVMRDWHCMSAHGVTIRAVPAYTVDDVYHDRSFGGLGFIITLMMHDIYFAGDTDLIPEMKTVGCDIALLPVGGEFTMGVEEAAEAVGWIKPLTVIPMHYGREIPGSRDDGRRFVQLVNSGVQALELVIENERVLAR
jgi:L-ascorbate metabolism protein UlaG (beta-lactamase superfamily)